MVGVWGLGVQGLGFRIWGHREWFGSSGCTALGSRAQTFVGTWALNRKPQIAKFAMSLDISIEARSSQRDILTSN